MSPPKKTRLACGVCNRWFGKELRLPSGKPFVLCEACRVDRFMLARAEEKAAT